MAKKKLSARPTAANKSTKVSKPTKTAKAKKVAKATKMTLATQPAPARKPVAGKKPIKKKTSLPLKKPSTKASGSIVAKSYMASIADKNTTDARIAALRAAPLAVCESDRSLQATLAILRDQNEPIKVRYQALQTLQAASFSVVSFEPCREDYIATLHIISEDPDAELRKRALGILARSDDPLAQKKLLDGLKNTDKALVPPERALQLLGNNPHAGAFKVARDIVASPPNPTAKYQALRLLSADSQSVDLFDAILGNKEESTENRQIAASALQAMYPEKLQERAREIVLASGEDSELQAKCLTALTHFGDQSKVTGDKTLVQQISKMSTAESLSVRQSASQFMDKYGQ